MRTLSLVVACQAGWMACVAGAASGRPLLGPAFVLLLLILRTAMSRVGERRALIVCAAGGAVLGVVLDGILALAGVLRFTAGGPGGPDASGWPAPMWMIALWVNLALVIDPLFAWLGPRPLAASIVGAIGGPVAYLTGLRLGALTLGPGLPVALTAIAAEWAIALPVLVTIAARMSPAASAVRAL
jgi:hypothetical protein